MHPYMIVEDFEVSDICHEHELSMIETFINKKIKSNEPGGYNTLYDNAEFTSVIERKFLDVVHNVFDVGPAIRPIKTWVYCQNNIHSKHFWHNHVSTSTVNAVFYISPPSNGGGLQIQMNDVVHTIPVQENKIYLFPYWLDHRPVGQIDDHWRISVNVEYFCRERPIVKKTQQIW